jgi:hypothetical protein
VRASCAVHMCSEVSPLETILVVMSVVRLLWKTTCFFVLKISSVLKSKLCERSVLNHTCLDLLI